MLRSRQRAGTVQDAQRRGGQSKNSRSRTELQSQPLHQPVERGAVDSQCGRSLGAISVRRIQSRLYFRGSRTVETSLQRLVRLGGLAWLLGLRLRDFSVERKRLRSEDFDATEHNGAFDH